VGGGGGGYTTHTFFVVLRLILRVTSLDILNTNQRLYTASSEMPVSKIAIVYQYTIQLVVQVQMQ